MQIVPESYAPAVSCNSDVEALLVDTSTDPTLWHFLEERAQYQKIQ